MLRVSEAKGTGRVDVPPVIEDDGDCAIPVHCEARELDALLIEIRNDRVAGDRRQTDWADRLAEAFQEFWPDLSAETRGRASGVATNG